MLGVLWPGEGRRVTGERVTLAGLRVLRVGLPPRGGRGRVDRAARLLVRAGVRRVLVHRQLAGVELGRGLRGPEVAELYAHLAPRLTLAALERRGLDPARTVVALVAGQVTGPLARAALELCPRVRGVEVLAGPGSGRLQSRLYESFGMAPDPGWRGDRLRVRFDGPWAGEELYLGPGGPARAGLRVVPEGLEAEGLDREELLWALWRAGLWPGTGEGGKGE